ncbi:MAG TPA: redoxin domain-containing protein [Pyrinomonadaceae bacterium]|jgi:thiol-disulfide isomerase/thioredoxin
MKKLLTALCLTCVLMTGFEVFAEAGKKDLNAPVPQKARELTAQSVFLAERDRFTESVAALQKAIAIAPNYVNAHAEYIQLKANFLNRYDVVRKEYEDLMMREPQNPVYPMALAIAQYQTSQTSKNAWLKKVVELAPEWSWSHYARALLIAEKEPETAAVELNKYIEADGSWISAYSTLAWIQEKTLKKLDDAIATTEKAAARPDSRSWNFLSLWGLRLGKAGGTEEAKASLRTELERIASTSRDVKILDAVRLAYSDLLKDEEKSKSVKAKMLQIDPAWYPERGRILYISARNMSGVPRIVVATNAQFSLWNKMSEFNGEMEPVEKIAGLEKLLLLKPSAEMKRYLYEQIFKVAEKAGNTNVLIKYGDLLYAIDPSDAAVPAKISIALANRKDAPKALHFARIAEKAMTVFRPVTPPANNGATAEEWRKERFSVERQQQFYKNLRALALDALGWSLCQAGRCADAEPYLKQSIESARTEQNLFHLAEVLGKLGRNEEAERAAIEAKNAYAEAIKKTFKKEPIKDFELSAIDGRRVKLSDLKGKVVLIDFWATWCGPCVKSTPTLNKLYAKYKERGFEILYVSVDEQSDLYKIALFVKDHKLGFPVLLDEGTKALYNVKVFPTTIFIDREGNIRHRDTGFGEESPRMLETVAELLLKTE